MVHGWEEHSETSIKVVEKAKFVIFKLKKKGV